MTEEAKPAVGRPTKYKPTYCEEVISLMATGLSFMAACAELGVHRTTAYDWAKEYPEFADALNLGRGKRVLFLERRLLGQPNADGEVVMSGPVVTSTIFALKNAAPEEWRDKHEHEVGGKGGAPIQINITAIEDQF